jgi:hypothetical protein
VVAAVGFSVALGALISYLAISKTNHGGHVAAARAPRGGALLSVWLPGGPARVEEPAG